MEKVKEKANMGIENDLEKGAHETGLTGLMRKIVGTVSSLIDLVFYEQQVVKIQWPDFNK